MLAGKSLVAALVTAALVGVSSPTPAPATAPATTAAVLPAVLPALRQWQPAAGTGFTFNGTGRILVEAPALVGDAHTFAADLSAVTGTKPEPVVAGTSADARPGDIVYGLDTTDPRLGRDGYRLGTGPVLSIHGSTAAGAFWGTRTAIQLLRQSSSLPAGLAIDRPKYPIRAAAVWAVVWKLGTWQNFVREMSYLKLNQLQLNSRFAGLSQQQFGKLQMVADQYHVTLVDTFSGIYALPVPDQYELVWANGSRLIDYLDISLPEAAAWARQQVASFADSRTSRTLHLAGDEYPLFNIRANQVNMSNFPGLYTRSQQQHPSSTPVADKFVAFHNELNDLVKRRGKTMEMWSDNIFPTTTVRLDSDIVLDHWISTGLTPAQLAANGNQIVNADQAHLFFTEGWSGNTTPQKIWEQFNPGVFNGGTRPPGGADDPHLAGLKMAFWGRGLPGSPSDPQPMSAGALEITLLPLIRALAQKSWGSAPQSSTWAGILPTIHAIGRAPGVIAAPGADQPGAGSLPGSPALTYGTSQQLFRTRSDGALMHTYWFPGSTPISETLPVAGPVTGRPTAFATPGNQLHAFARGINGHLQHTFWDGPTSTWHTDDWTSAAAAAGSPELDIASDPTGFSYGGQQHVFARGSNGMLHHWWWSPGDNRVRADVWGAHFTGNPSAYVWGTTQNVVVRATDGSLEHWWWQPGDTSRPQHTRLGGSIAAGASPSGLPYGATEQNIFARGADNHIRRWSHDPAVGSGFVPQDLTTSTGVNIAGDLSAFMYGNQKHILAREAGTSHLVHVWFSPGSAFLHDDWTASTPGAQVNPVGDPSSMLYQNAELHAFAPDSAGAMHHWWRTISNNALHQDSWG